MTDILTTLFDAADQHGEDSEPDHTVGDLQDLLREAWALMSTEQRRELLQTDAVEAMLMLGAPGVEVEDLEGMLDEEDANDVESDVQQPFTVVGMTGDNDEIICVHTTAADSLHAFYRVAGDHEGITLVVAIPGHHYETDDDLGFPGSAVVDGDTVLSQPEVFNTAGQATV